MTPILSYTIEWQAGHLIPAYMDINTMSEGSLWVLSCTRSVSFFFFSGIKRAPVLAVTLSYRSCTKPALEDLHEGIIGWSWLWARYYPFFLSWVSVHLYSILEARDDGNGNTNRQEQSQFAKWTSHNSQNTKDVHSIHLCFYSSVLAFMGYTVCCIGIRKM